MTGRTHDLSAFTLLNLMFISIPTPAMTVSTLIGAFGGCFIGGLFPDIDQSTADLYRRFPAGSLVGKIIAPILGSHRMISHSFFGIAVIGYLLRIFLTRLGLIVLIDMNIVWWAFMIGMVSHILMDLLTHEGEPLLFPLPWKFGFPPFSFLRIHTGGIVEKGLIFPGLMILNGYLVYHYTHQYLVFFKQFIH